MILGIDASNIRGGGGVTYLAEMLAAAKPFDYGFTSVVLFGGNETLNKVADRSWLVKVHDPLLDRSLPYRIYWQKAKLDRAVRKASCDLLYVPGSTYSGNFSPFVTISRNMLPFEWNEAKRYGLSWQIIRLILLRLAQKKTFTNAGGVIFLTEYAKKIVTSSLVGMAGLTTIIPHGINPIFSYDHWQDDVKQGGSSKDVFRVLYVSTIDMYKHQWHVAEAVSLLNDSGLSVHLDLIGPAYKPAMKRLLKAIEKDKRKDKCISYHGSIPYRDLPQWYKKADLFVFASSCENMPNILVEAMASRLPIACSSAGPMREILGDEGMYFDPEKPAEIARVIRTMISSPDIRQKSAKSSYERSRSFSWDRCADETFAFMKKITISFGKSLNE